MKMDAADIQRVFEAGVAGMSDPKLVALAESWRVEPRCEKRPWSYSNTSYPCWIVLEDKDSNVGIAYCEQGFGPRCPWGLLWLSGQHLHMGDDSGWFPTLEQAIRDAAPLEN